MKLVCLILAVASTAAAESSPHANQLRADAAISGPGGLLAVRYSRVFETGMRIEPAIGLAYTGVLGSMLVTQPLTSWYRPTPNGPPRKVSLELYGGYGVSVLRDRLHHPWTGRQSFLPNGNYHWVDMGMSTQTTWKGILITTGVGTSLLVAAPMHVGGEHVDEETLDFLFPEVWMAKLRWVPTLWTSFGWGF